MSFLKSLFGVKKDEPKVSVKVQINPVQNPNEKV
jgi:hypothetical protein